MNTLSPADRAVLYDPTTQRGRRTTQITRVLRLVRRDGFEHRFTIHDQVVGDLRTTWSDFSPEPGLFAMAIRKEAGLSDRTTEYRGLVGTQTGAITFADIRSGKLDGAAATEAFIDWRFPWRSYGLPVHEYDVTKSSVDQLEWVLELSHPVHRTNRKIGEIYSRKCQNQLGQTIAKPSASDPQYVISHCTVNTAAYPLRVSNAIVQDASDGQPNPTRTSFVCIKGGGAGGSGFQIGASANLPHGTDYFSNGFCEFASGANGLSRYRIHKSTQLSESLQQIELLTPTPFPISGNDLVVLVVGCDKQFATCKAKFANTAQFRGAKDIPGFDRAIRIGSSAT